MPAKLRPIAERFWEKVDKRGPDACWPWQASRTECGYGKFGISGGGWKHAHRVAHELSSGKKQGALHVLHSCDNPPCCNPAHLSLGTRSENMRQAHARGRTKNTFARRGITARHGTRSMYNYGCRCAGCYTAEREYRTRSKEKALTK